MNVTILLILTLATLQSCTSERIDRVKFTRAPTPEVEKTSDSNQSSRGDKDQIVVLPGDDGLHEPTKTVQDNESVVKEPVVEVVEELKESDSKILKNMLGVDVGRIKVTNLSGGDLYKGQVAKVEMDVKSDKTQSLKMSLLLTSKTFSDYTLATASQLAVDFKANSTKKIYFQIVPMFKDVKSNKEFALGASNYCMSFRVQSEAGTETTATDVQNACFDVRASNVNFIVVASTKEFDNEVKYPNGLANYLKTMMRRKTEIYDMSTQKYTSFPDGFGQMMGMKFVFKTMQAPNLYIEGNEYYEPMTKMFKDLLGLAQDVDNPGKEMFTSPKNHGFDSFVLMSHQFRDGGLNWGHVTLQSPQEVDMTEVYLLHELGHGQGAPHCDPYRGYMMCVGEDHEHWKRDKTYVWLKSTYDTMTRGRDVLSKLPEAGKFKESDSSIYEPK
jgi:rRNA maturation endonuclease Nob1